MASKPARKTQWTHPSILALSADDPIAAIIERARQAAFSAIEAGWTGPPFDPVSLADLLGVRIVARDDIQDARTVPIPGDKLQVEFNPNRPKARIRFSIAHELAHTLFPDCRDQIRNRVARTEMRGDEWQLEMLCNLGAAEFLMPAGSMMELQEQLPTIDALLELRERYGVSMEAVSLRLHKLTHHRCCVFAASRKETGPESGRYQLDYILPTKDWSVPFRASQVLPEDTAVSQCTAIGFTAKEDEKWDEHTGILHVECVGVSPYPDHTFPRVLGLITTAKQRIERWGTLEYLHGDALQPRGAGNRIIAHVVNDKTPRWGAGFAKALATKWPAVQNDFIQWSEGHRGEFRLGNSHLSVIDKTLSVFHMIAQHGYGPSPKPRIRYGALEKCIRQLAEQAVSSKAVVHAPRFGCGEAGGRWEIVSELIEDVICREGINVVIYLLPGDKAPMTVNNPQGLLFG